MSYTRFHEQYIEELRNSNKYNSAKINYETLKSIQRFYKKNVIEFREITPTFYSNTNLF